MLGLSKSIRNILLSKNAYNNNLMNRLLKVKSHTRVIHSSSRMCVKIFMEKENHYAFEILKRTGQVSDFIKTETRIPMSKEDFERLTSKNWLNESKEEIFEHFKKFATYSTENKLCISNSVFDNFVDSLTDNIQNATDEELKSLFYTLTLWPETNSIRTRNYIEIWAALDDECINRFKKWSFDEWLSYIYLFYLLNATRASDFCYKSIQRLTYKSHKLTKSQYIQTMFYIATMRFSPSDMHNLELCLEKNYDQFNLDELAVVSMGFFKSQIPIRSMNLVSKIIDNLVANIKEIHEVSLAALLKIVRFSRKIPIDDKIITLLDILQHEVPRLSVMCNVHIALLAASTLTLHEPCLTKIADKVLDNISLTRLKDIERLVLTFGTFSLEPKTKRNFIETVLSELRKPIREDEIKIHGRSFACCVSYLGLLQSYPLDLMKRVLNKEFLLSNYGKHCLSYGREILTLHNQIQIMHKDVDWQCLSDKEALSLAKKYTDYIPDENYKKQYNITERMFLDVKKVLEETRGGKEFVGAHHIVTHHQRGDLIICDSKEGTPSPVTEISKSKFGFNWFAPNDNNIWIALIIAGRNAMIYNSDIPCGQFYMKARELNALGFCSTIVSWRAYEKCQTYEEKRKYLNQLICEAKHNQKSINGSNETQYLSTNVI
ncbi:unnamed protein product [Leptidea sinapis]|uniref:RAP domain-containing protein n=1 Tax=Leptidea sinapis TaxID=189913 RepID=A0A5E4QNH7_9NEOP|nr:unnamed protein product [Leptidea sinapis]